MAESADWEPAVGARLASLWAAATRDDGGRPAGGPRRHPALASENLRSGIYLVGDYSAPRWTGSGSTKAIKHDLAGASSAPF